MKSTVMAALAAAFLVCSLASPATSQKKPMGSTHHPQIIAIQGTDTAPETPPNTDEGIDYYVWFNQLTQRLSFLDENAVSYELPTMDPDENYAQALLMLNEEGRLATTPNFASAWPLVQTQNFPTGIRLPQGPSGNVRVGDVMTVTGIVSETARDEVTSVDRAVLSWGQAELRVTNDPFTADLNTTHVQNAWFNDSGRDFFVTKIVFKRPSTAITTAQFGLGTNASASDVLSHDAYPSLALTNSYVVVQPTFGAVLVPDSTFLKFKCSIAEGSAATVEVDVFGYYD